MVCYWALQSGQLNDLSFILRGETSTEFDIYFVCGEGWCNH